MFFSLDVTSIAPGRARAFDDPDACPNGIQNLLPAFLSTAAAICHSGRRLHHHERRRPHLMQGKMARRWGIFQTLLLVVTLLIHVSSAASQRYLSRRRGEGRRFLSSTLPVSYRSQKVTPSKTDVDFYNRRGYRPWKVDFTPKSPGHYSWTSQIVFTNVLCYALQVFCPTITRKGIKLSEPLLQGKQLWRCVTPMFLHGGVPHLLTNIYSLQAVGNDVERYFGPGRYLLTYLVSGVVANYVSAIKTPNPSLGASGAVFGIVGAYYVFLNRNMVR